MIYFISLLCSFCIQFAAIEFPINYTPVNEYFSSEILTVWQNLVSAGYNVDLEKLILVNRSDSLTPSGSAPYAVFYPAEPFNQQQSSIIVTTQADAYIQVSATNFYRWLLKSDFSISSGPALNNIAKVGIYDIESGIYTNSSGNIMYNNYYPMPYNGNINYPTFTWSSSGGGLPGMGGLGTLSGSGHSPGGSPFEELENSSYNWASMTGHSSGGVISPSPHSSSTHYNSTTPSPDANDSKTDSLLYMLGNKLADITENTGAIGDILGGIMYNQVAGASALFNALSGINENLKDTFTPPSKEDFVDMIHTSEIYTSYQNVSTSVSAMTTTLNSVGQQSDYIWEIPLPETWGGTLTFNFSSYLDTNSLNFIRILIGAILIISTVVFVAHQFPDIIGGGSGGENA